MKKTTISLLIFFSLAPFFFVESAEYRMGLSMHDVERRIEGGPALSFEKIFDRPGWLSLYAGRPHLGTHISLANNTHLLYAGSTWNLFKKGRFSGELGFGAAIHSGKEKIENNSLGFGCKVNFREMIAFGYEIKENTILQISAQHMSNGSLCDPNQGLTSVGFRLAWKIN